MSTFLSVFTDLNYNIGFDSDKIRCYYGVDWCRHLVALLCLDLDILKFQKQFLIISSTNTEARSELAKKASKDIFIKATLSCKS